MTDSDEGIQAVTLRRGACRGFCPVYEVTLRTDGTAEWQGERHVDRVGRFQGELDAADVQRVAAFMERSGFWGWEDEYVGTISDAPDYELVAVAGSRTKAVRQNASDEPPEFWVIAALVDGLAAGIDWKRAPSGGDCGDWTATLTMEGVVAPLLTVRGVCTFPTAGYQVELRQHRSPSKDPDTLLLHRVVSVPSGMVADVITEVEVIYAGRHVVDRVVILPDGITLDVETTTRPAFD